jgi:DNA-3-methyladenine glycosylase
MAVPLPARDLRFRGREQEHFVPLSRSLYLASASVVAPLLLGHWLIRRTRADCCGGVIVETEAYLADDPACHAFRGPTARNRAMFGPPGHAYVYFIYGTHHCVNAVCRPQGYGEAVLIRAIETDWGEDAMRLRRKVTHAHQLTNGPGKLCAALHIERELDGADLCAAAGSLLIASNPDRSSLLLSRGPIVTAPRVGLTKAADRLLRFYLAGSPCVSRKHPRPPPQ